MRRWLVCAMAVALLGGAAGCGDGGSDEPPLPPGAPDPGRGEADPRPTPGDVAGCDGANLYANPADPGEDGPWPVGVRTATVAGLTTEIWYPAERGAQVGVRHVLYDLREWLPPSEADKIPDEDTAWQICDCYRDLPIDADHGPYPLIVFVHGTAGFRTQSLHFMTHWASRGFVVVAADYPKLFLGDLLSNLANFGMADVPGDTMSLLAGLGDLTGDLAFLDGHLDTTHIGMSGHSAGGFGIRGFGDTAEVLIPMAASGTMAGTALESTLVLGGLDDGVVDPTGTLQGYMDSPEPKRFLGLADAGHLAFSDICALSNQAGEDILTIAIDHGVMNAQFASALFDGCTADYLPPEDGWAIVEYATSAVFEETLQCNPDAAADLPDIGMRFPAAADYRQAP